MSMNDDFDTSLLWLFGAAINICGSIMINLGTNVMKVAHTKAAERYKKGLSVSKIADVQLDDKLRSRVSGSGTPLWRIGSLLFIIGNMLNFLSFAFSNQSLLAALGSVQFVSNVIFAWKVLGARITLRIILASSLIVLGNVIIVLFSSHSSRNFTVDELLENYTRLAYRIYLYCAATAVVALSILYYAYRRRVAEHLTLRMRVAFPKALPSSIDKILPTSYALVSALIGTQSVILAKSLADILRLTIEGENQLIYGFTYVILLLWGITMVFWLKRMNRALQIFDGVFIIPVLQVVWILFSIVGGGVYFREFEDFSLTQSIMFVCGVLCILAGVMLLAPRKDKSQHVPEQLGHVSAPAELSVQTIPLVFVEDDQYEHPSSEPDYNLDTLSRGKLTQALVMMELDKEEHHSSMEKEG